MHEKLVCVGHTMYIKKRYFIKNRSGIINFYKTFPMYLILMHGKFIHIRHIIHI